MPESASSSRSPASPTLESLALRYLDRQLGSDEISALNARLAASPADRDAFVQVCTQSWELREMLKTRLATAQAGALLLGDDADDAAVAGERSGMNESMVLPAVHEADLAATDEPEPAEVIRFPRRAADRQERTLWGLARRFGWAAAAAVIAIGLSVWWIARPGPAATLAGVAEARWESSSTPLTVGVTLLSGKPVRLKSGLAELAFDDGVRVIIEGPAELTPVDGRNATLAYGKLRARVPHGAEGFRVAGAGLMVTDLGTEFGMSIAAAGAVAEVHVFDGKVEVGLPAPKDEKQASPAPKMMTLSRDEALRCQPAAPGGSASVERIASRTESFVEDIRRPRIPIPLRGSGAGLAVGQPDPQWTIAVDQGDDAFAAQPAYVARVDSNIHRTNDPQTSQWLSNAGDFPPMPKVASYRFRTRIDLSGFDPSTVVLRARVVMDDELLDVRVNGSSTAQALPYRELESRQNFGEVVLDRGFTNGPNDVEFVVKNVQAMTQLGVRVEWSASGLKAKGN